MPIYSMCIALKLIFKTKMYIDVNLISLQYAGVSKLNVELPATTCTSEF